MSLVRKSSKEEPTRSKNRLSFAERDVFGRWTEAIARGMGTPWFLLVLTIICGAWIAWNTLAPEELRFDSAAIGFTALTLILSLQASYAAPMLLLAQNRQDDRDRVQIEQDRFRAERNLADTEFLAREVVALRLALKEIPDKDWMRQEIKNTCEEMLRAGKKEMTEANGLLKETEVGNVAAARLKREKESSTQSYREKAQELETLLEQARALVELLRQQAEREKTEYKTVGRGQE